MSRTDAATRERLRRAAHRAAGDPVKLASSTRIVQAAISSERLSLEEHVRRIVDSAPPLTAAQRSKIAAMLQPA